MAILSNVNGKFAVDSTGAIQFSGQTGTSGYVLKSNGNAAPTWVDGSTVIGGPYLPLSGGTLTGATATASGISFTVGGALTVTGTSTLTGVVTTGGDIYIPSYIRHVGDTNTYIGFSGNDTIDLTTNSNVALRIDSSGNIQIPTNSAKIQLRSSGSSSYSSIYRDASNVIQIANTAGTNIFSIDNGGDVGITATAYLGFNGAGDASHSVGYNAGIDGAMLRGQNGVILGTGGGATAVERMRIDSSGNVGIAAIPGAVASNIRVLRIGQRGVFSAYTTSGNVYMSNNVRVISNGNNTAIVTGESAQYRQADGTHIWYNAASVSAGAVSTLTERMRISSDGILKFPNTAQTRKIQLWSTQDNDYEFYGFGIEGSTLVYSVYTTGDSHVFFSGTNSSTRKELMRITGDGGVGIGTSVTTGGFNVNNTTAGSYYNMSNADSGNYKYTNPVGRLLTSNATGWFSDGRDPILTLSTSGNSNNSAIGNSIGLNLYTNSGTYGNFSPLITFSALSDSGSYASTYAAIAGRKVNRGPDTNWNTGDLCFWVTGPVASGNASYMQQTPSMIIQTGGNVGIGTASPSTKLSINDANYVEMATFSAASGSTAGIVSNNSGYITSFTTSGTHQNSNTALFVPVANGIKITKAGLLQVMLTQDFQSTLTTGYAYVRIDKNNTVQFYSLRTNSNGQWDMFNSSGTMIVAANDVIGFYYGATDFISMDTGAWSQYSFVWTSR